MQIRFILCLIFHFVLFTFYSPQSISDFSLGCALYTPVCLQDEPT